jgi:signal transduction histidine kinase
MMEIQEEARRKLARDLHDGPTQSVAAIAMRVNFARRLMERESVQRRSMSYQKSRTWLAEQPRKSVTCSSPCDPLVLESKGLVAALEAMAEKMKDTYDQNVIVDADPIPGCMPSKWVNKLLSSISSKRLLIMPASMLKLPTYLGQNQIHPTRYCLDSC